MTQTTSVGTAETAENPFTLKVFLAGSILLKTMGMHMAAGRSFSSDFGAEGGKVILNETAVKVMRLENPVGKNVNFGDNKIQIIGVVKDFHFESLHETVKPSFIVFANGTSPYYKMMIKIKAEWINHT